MPIGQVGIRRENERLREDYAHLSQKHDMFKELFCHAGKQTPQPNDSMIAAYQAYMDAHLLQVQPVQQQVARSMRLQVQPVQPQDQQEQVQEEGV